MRAYFTDGTHDGDIEHAETHHIQEAPSFVSNQTLAISGAQDPALFTQALDRATRRNEDMS